MVGLLQLLTCVHVLIFLLLSIFNIRTMIVKAIPKQIRYAVAAGIGLFISLMGLIKSGFIVDDPVTLVAFGGFKDENDKTWLPWDTKWGGFWEGGKHWSEIVADDALNFIKDAEQQEQPFFMYVAFNAPHDPRQSPKEFVDKYPLENIS